jgi:hypothetical protein
MTSQAIPVWLGAIVLLAILAATIALAAAGIAAMKRSSRNTRGSGALGNAIQELEGLFVESKKHAITVQRAEQEEEDQSGDPPEK